MIPFDVMDSGFDLASNGWGIIIFSEGLNVFGFPIMKPSFSFTHVKTITIPAICSVNNSGMLWTICGPCKERKILCIEWDPFDILANGKTDYHCKIKETFFIQELEPAFNVSVGSEKQILYLHKSHNTPLLPPKCSIIIACNFSWDTEMSQEKSNI